MYKNKITIFLLLNLNLLCLGTNFLLTYSLPFANPAILRTHCSNHTKNIISILIIWFHNRKIKYCTRKLFMIYMTYPSKLELVQSKTLSLLFFIRKNSSQLSHPSNSNWSNVCKIKIFSHIIVHDNYNQKYQNRKKHTLIKEHTKQALRLRKSLATVSIIVYFSTCNFSLIF